MTGRRHIVPFLVALLTFLVGAPALAGFAAPPKPSTPVYDGADVLTAAQEKEIAATLTSFREKNGTEIGVAILPTLGDYDLRETGYEIAQAWGIGDAKRKDGVLLLVVVDKAKAAGPGAQKCGCAVIEVGEYLEGTLTDAASVHVLKDTVLAPVVEGKYYEAVKAGTAGIMAVVGGDAEAAKKYAETKDGGGEQKTSIPWWVWVVGILILVVLQALGVPVIDIVLAILSAGRSGGGGSSGGGSSGGFGGGGSFGGGGGKI